MEHDMARSIKIPDREMELVREEAELCSRSIAGQVTHWMRIGRSIERSPDFSYMQVREALGGNRSPDELSGKEQAVYLDELMAVASETTEEQRALFTKRREQGLGVGMDAAGNIVRQRAKRGR